MMGEQRQMSELTELSLRVFSELRGTERASTMQATIEGGSFLNSGQACFAGTRLLVPKSRLDEVKQAIIETIPAFPVGDPADPKAAVGPW